MTTKDDNRSKFLLELYNQLWNSINARISVSWQSIGILVSAFAVMTLTQNNIISLSFASSILILLVVWYLAHLIDISFWYNRNQAMITNIEREFLNEDDSKLIHPYFLSHRPNKMVKVLAIQSYLGVGIGVIVLILHYFGSVLPVIKTDYTMLNIETILPELILVIGLFLLKKHSTNRDKQYTEFIKASPGKEISSGTPTSGNTKDED